MPGHLILARPHASRWDGFVVAWYLRQVGGHGGYLFAVDPDYARHPVYRRVLNGYGRLMGGHTMVPLDQRSPLAMRTLIRTLQGGGKVVLFPQGTGLTRPDRPDLPGAAWLIRKARPLVTELRLDHSGRVPVVVPLSRGTPKLSRRQTRAHRGA
jgi:1-acyl-sn-glycerol-3-phosphate acyltransferase